MSDIPAQLSEPMTLMRTKDVKHLADRIEELEADLRKMALDYLAAEGQAAEAYQAQLAAEAKLAKAVGQMQRVKDYRYDPNIGIELNRLEEALLNRLEEALAELKGEDQG